MAEGLEVLLIVGISPVGAEGDDVVDVGSPRVATFDPLAAGSCSAEDHQAGLAPAGCLIDLASPVGGAGLLVGASRDRTVGGWQSHGIRRALSPWGS